MNDNTQKPKRSEEEAQKKSESKALDEQLANTFPASDPPASVTPHPKDEKPKSK